MSPRIPADFGQDPDPRRQLNGWLNQRIPQVKEPLAQGFAEIGEEIPTQKLINMARSGRGMDADLRRVTEEKSREIVSGILIPNLEEAMLAADKSLDATTLPIRQPNRRVQVRNALDNASEGVREYLTNREDELSRFIGRNAAAVAMDAIRIAVREGRQSVGDAAAALSHVITVGRHQASRLIRSWTSDINLGMSVGAALRRLEERAREARRERAELVMEHESSKAWNEGTLESVKQRKRDGTIDPDVVKVWITVGDDRVCEVCAPLHLQGAEVEGTFDNESAAREVQEGIDPAQGRGTLKIDVSRDARMAVLTNSSLAVITQGPPAHIRCRCVLAYRRRPVAADVRKALVHHWQEEIRRAA